MRYTKRVRNAHATLELQPRKKETYVRSITTTKPENANGYNSFDEPVIYDHEMNSYGAVAGLAPVAFLPAFRRIDLLRCE
jgi:hypothetical protein